MRNLLTRVRLAYGANPVHLLSLLACFTITGYVVTRLAGDPSRLRILAWFAGAVVAHDLIAFPLYTVTDRAVAAALAQPGRRPRVPLLNYIRVPAGGSALLFLVFLPGIIRQGDTSYHAATGQTQQPFLLRWLLFTAVMFATSAVVYVLRFIRAGHAPSHDPH